MDWINASRGAVVAAAVVAALTAPACGDSDDGPSRDAAPEPASARQQLDALMDGFRAAITDGDAEKGCALLAKQAVKELATYKREQQSAPASCVQGFEQLVKGQYKEDVEQTKLRFSIDGDTATVSGWVVHDGERETARFVREDGSWKILRWFA